MDPSDVLAKRDATDHHTQSVEDARAANLAAGRPGLVLSTANAVRGLGFVVRNIDGYRAVLPNFRHANSKQGEGLARLSPKSLGPLPWSQTDAPVMLNIENMYQGSKVWLSEVSLVQLSESAVLRDLLSRLQAEEAPDAGRNLTREIRVALGNGNLLKLTANGAAVRSRVLTDAEPHRHKYTKPEMRRMSGAGVILRPLFSMLALTDGQGQPCQVFLTYVQSRYVYCHFMEVLARPEPEWARLSQWRRDGYNLNICGYDGYTSAPGATPWSDYLDVSRPFGHEKVLETMLKVEDPADYPWNRFRREHPEIYAELPF